MTYSRRRFLQGAGASVFGAPFAITAANAAGPKAPKKWDESYDVVVIGYGGAGACAAIAAHDAGAKVVILEKLHEGGGNTAISSGGLLNPNNEEKGAAYMKALFDAYPTEFDEEFFNIFVKESPKLCDWVKSLKPGTEMRCYGHSGYPHLPGADAIDKWSVSTPATGKKRGGGPNLWAVYSYAVEEARKIPVKLNTPAERLYTNTDGVVIGVRAKSNGKIVNIQAKRGVVLACGGFASDETMCLNHLHCNPVFSVGSPGNTGDGIRMAQQVGAGIWHMNGTNAPLGIRIPGQVAAAVFRCNSPGYILVDRNARRFVDEKSIEGHSGIFPVDVYDGRSIRFERIPCFAIFDHKGLTTGGPVSAISSGYFRLTEKGGHNWTRNNLKEVEKGWIIKADTVEELAKKIHLDPKVLAETVKKWNTDIKNGHDTLFNRPIENKLDKSKVAYDYMYNKVLAAPLEQGPYYAVELYPCLFNTQGGPRRNAKTEVLDPFLTPIPHLYSAGELGSFWGPMYQGGGNNSECIVSGRIAGKNAASQKPVG